MAAAHHDPSLDICRLPADVAALVDALQPGQQLLLHRAGAPVATITRTPGAPGARPPDDQDVSVVATAMTLSSSARAALSDQLGPGYLVLDVNDAPPTAEVLLIPPVSPQLIGALRSRFPVARVVIAEVDDPDLGVVHVGPVRRLLDAGADADDPPRRPG